MANHNLNNIIYDRVLRAIYSDKNDDIIFALNQVQNLSINATTESQEVVDAVGCSVRELMRSKAIEISAENAFYDMGLQAAQYGTEKVVADKDNKLPAYALEEFEVTADRTYKLKHTPTSEITTIYALNGDSTLGDKYVTDLEKHPEAAGEFVYADGVISIPEGVEEKSFMFVKYEYDSEHAVEVISTAKDFPKMGKLLLEVLVYDTCDPETKILAYVEAPRFQLKGDYDWSIGADNQAHPFNGVCHVDYCDREKKMIRVLIVDDEEEI